MARLVDRIEEVMYSVNPFGFHEGDGGNYYYEANNMIKLLAEFKLGQSILDLCMDAFQIYNDGNQKWVEIAEKITPLVVEYKSFDG